MFAGYGGLELGISQVLDIETTWVAEFDAAPSRILAQRFPDVPNLGDVTAVDWAAVEPVDIITGGSPCQDVSHAGKRAGMRAGTRSGLWASMCDAIEIIRPRLVVWENVRGALSAEADSAVEPCPICVGDGNGVSLRALGRVLGDLAELGYDAAWCGLRAADVGAPHGRFRVFVLAWDAAADADGTARGERGFPAPGEAEGGWARADAGRRGGAPSADGVNLLPTPTTTQRGTDANASTRAEAGPNLHNAVALLPTPKATNNENRQSLDRYGPNLGMALSLLPKPSVADVEGGRKHRSGERSDELLLNGLAHAQAFGQYAPAIARWEAVLDRPAPAPTEPTGKGGAHRLSPRFVEWLMGLPEGWVTDTDSTRNEQLKALGNGVVPQQAAAAVRHLLAVRSAALAGMHAVM